MVLIKQPGPAAYIIQSLVSNIFIVPPERILTGLKTYFAIEVSLKKYRHMVNYRCQAQSDTQITAETMQAFDF